MAGHTATYFRDFEHAQNGAMITVTTAYGTYTYEITDMRVANANDTSAYDMDAPEENIILYTCYPLGQVSLTDMRYFIYGKYVSGPRLEGCLEPPRQAGCSRSAGCGCSAGRQCLCASAGGLSGAVLYAPAGRTFCRLSEKSGYLDTVHAAVLDTCSQYAAAIGTTADPLANAITPDAVYAGVMHRADSLWHGSTNDETDPFGS